MSSQPSTDNIAIVGSGQDNTIADALRAAELAAKGTDVQAQNATIQTEAQKKAEAEEKERRVNAAIAQMHALADRAKHKTNRHNTPFDGRKRKAKSAKSRAKRKANKKRKLYVRYGKQT